MEDKRKKYGLMAFEILMMAVLILYPLRHVYLGGDLWDVGYNYGNFTYSGIDQIGKMWFFSTYLAIGLGHLLTLLPFGNTLIGLNVYTGLFISISAVMGYLFFTRVLKVPQILAFAGEVIAISMCWCPTALLYNYLTYVLLTGCMILLYQGFMKKKAWMLVLAGAFLGLNVFVRFSNLPEMGLILAVWLYAFFETFEESGKEKGWIGKGFGNAGKYTLFCLAGYLGAVLIIGGWIAIRYDISEYVGGIQLLFAMTDVAADYKPNSMITDVIWQYWAALYWVVRLAFFAAVAVIARMITDLVPLCFGEKSSEKLRKVCDLLGMLCIGAITVIMVLWMFKQREQGNLTGFAYTSYDPIYWLGTLFLMLAMCIGFVEVVRPGNAKEGRFLGAGILLLVLLTSLGSNNGVYTSMNYMFLAAPYLLWKMKDFSLYCLKRSMKKANSVKEIRPSLVPISVTVWAFVLVCTMQFFLFGRYFVFCEGTGMKETGCKIDNNSILNGTLMGFEREAYLRDVTDYANANNLKGQEVILHGDVPALSFYLEMPPVFHSWNDLDSYSIETMEEAIAKLEKDMEESGRAKPVVIARSGYVEYGPILPEDSDDTEPCIDEKWELIRRYMGRHGYELSYLSGWFVIWEAK